ncbi:MAG: hypothetical protein ABI743_10005, partial [bacterium]
ATAGAYTESMYAKVPPDAFDWKPDSAYMIWTAAHQDQIRDWWVVHQLGDDQLPCDFQTWAKGLTASDYWRIKALDLKGVRALWYLRLTPELERLQLRDSDIHDLSPLKDTPQLTDLDLREALTAVVSCPENGARSFYFGSEICSPVVECRYPDIRIQRAVNLTPIAALSHLKRLCLGGGYGHPISNDFRPLEQLTGLEELVLDTAWAYPADSDWQGHVAPYYGWEGSAWADPRRTYPPDNKIVDAERLTALKSLRVLTVDNGTCLRHPEALSQLPQLESLTCALFSEIETDRPVHDPTLMDGDLSRIGAHGLTSLTVSLAQWTTITGWESLPRLESLTIDGANLTAPGWPTQSTRLKHLTLHLVSAAPTLFQTLPQSLESICLDRCASITLDSLIRLPRLQTVVIREYDQGELETRKRALGEELPSLRTLVDRGVTVTYEVETS